MRCPECNKDISDKAELCIHCGYPIKRILSNEQLYFDYSMTCPVCHRNGFEYDGNTGLIQCRTCGYAADENKEQHDKYIEDTQIKKIQSQHFNQPKCPKCGSTSIQIVPRKWSLLTGFRTNQADRVCVNCKHKW